MSNDISEQMHHAYPPYPLPMWSAGCQMVALNFQQGDRTNMFNRAKFLQNGNCGYVLKPGFLSNPELYSVQSTDKLKTIPGRKVIRIQLVELRIEHNVV